MRRIKEFVMLVMEERDTNLGDSLINMFEKDGYRYAPLVTSIPVLRYSTRDLITPVWNKRLTLFQQDICDYMLAPFRSDRVFIFCSDVERDKLYQTLCKLNTNIRFITVTKEYERRIHKCAVTT